MEEKEKYLLQKKDALELQFALLIISTLALSIQFQGKPDAVGKDLLITGWIVLVIAIIATGYRILITLNIDFSWKTATSKGKLEEQKAAFDKYLWFTKIGKYSLHVQIFLYLVGVFFLLTFSILNLQVEAKNPPPSICILKENQPATISAPSIEPINHGK